MSRYRSFLLLGASDGDVGFEERHEVMKSWRSGFMRCRRREEPWGSHHEEARAEKWESSLGETEVWGFELVVEIERVEACDRRRKERLRREVARKDMVEKRRIGTSQQILFIILVLVW